MLGCYFFRRHSSFSFSHILSFEEEFIITLFKLAVVQEKQLSTERLFSLDSIYPPYREDERTILSVYSFSCIQIERMLYFPRDLMLCLYYYASNIFDESCKSSGNSNFSPHFAPVRVLGMCLLPVCDYQHVLKLISLLPGI